VWNGWTGILFDKAIVGMLGYLEAHCGGQVIFEINFVQGESEQLFSLLVTVAVCI